LLDGRLEGGAVLLVVAAELEFHEEVVGFIDVAVFEDLEADKGAGEGVGVGKSLFWLEVGGPDSVRALYS
jgi:hypothetical protein